MWRSRRGIELQDKYKVVDLFCGAGGLSQGFCWAGYDIIAGIDHNPEALLTYSKNFANALTLNEDLSLPENITKIIDKLKGHNIDILLGGPPCQGYSIAGKRQVHDPRNQLFKSYIEIVKNLGPKVILIENVPNILSMGNGMYKDAIINDLKNLGYNVEVMKLNSANFGVPQNRNRAFFIASKNNLSSLLKLNSIVEDNPITTEMALSDLPLLEDIFESEEMDYCTGPLNNYQKFIRIDSSKIYNHGAVKHTETTKRIISLVPDGGNYKDLPLELQGTRKVNIAWTRMNSKKPCFTIDAGHNHHFHYLANRVPTVRECARIQSFPDNFIFVGKRTSQYKQVGNAVPPLLAKAIANLILEIL